MEGHAEPRGRGTAGTYGQRTRAFPSKPLTALFSFSGRVGARPLTPQRWGHTLVDVGGLAGRPREHSPRPCHCAEPAQGPDLRGRVTLVVLFLEKPIPAFLPFGILFLSFLLPHLPPCHLSSEGWENTPPQNMPLWCTAILNCRHFKNSKYRERLSPNFPLSARDRSSRGTQLSHISSRSSSAREDSLVPQERGLAVHTGLTLSQTIILPIRSSKDPSTLPQNHLLRCAPSPFM